MRITVIQRVREARAIILAATAFGLVVSGLVMYVAWRHNPQGEFHEPGVIHWKNLLWVGLPWFLIALAPGAVLGMIARALTRPGNR